MNIKPHLLLIACLNISCGVQAENQGKGRVLMHGEIVESACTIATDDIWQEIDFGDISIKEIARRGVETHKRISLHLVNCRLERENGTRWSSAIVTFAENNVSAEPGLFSMQGKGGGIGLLITDSDGVAAKSGVALPPVLLSEHSTDINFNLQLVDNGQPLLAGDVSTSLRFMVDWQ